ncbi:MAG: hypothetical protein SPM02_03110 [Bacteroidales bacterium]|nr:hypothetical protein [Bacteroidales bacterium]
MRIIEITEHLGNELSQACEEALRANGRLMSCIEQVMQGSSMGERNGMGPQGMYPGMYPQETMGERRMMYPRPDIVMGDRMGMREPYYGDRYDNYGDRGYIGNRGRRY